MWTEKRNDNTQRYVNVYIAVEWFSRGIGLLAPHHTQVMPMLFLHQKP